MRVSEVLSKAGDLTPNSSIRIIELRRADGSVRAKADLKKYYATGDLSANPIVESGDVIVVERPIGLVVINGAVAKAGTYEFSPGDKLSTVISLAGGALPGARFDSIEIARFAADNPTTATRFYVNFLNGADEPLQEGDVISIRGYGQYHVPRLVSIGGEITYPGRYSIEVGKTRILDIIQRAGGILPTGSIEEAVILRRAGVGSWEYDPEFVMLERLKGTADEKRFTDDQYNYYMARSRQLGRSVMVVNFKDLITKQDQSQNLLLRDNDSIWIPRERGFVSVIGSVNSPGNVNYAEGLSYKDYIARAGGFTSSADKGEVRVINARSSGYIDPSSNNYQIGPGDTIVIPESRSHFWENFQLVTAITAQVVTIIAGIILLKQANTNKN
jgi:polysaccharide export outer membrane protein